MKTTNIRQRIEQLEQRPPAEPDRASPAGRLFATWRALEYLGQAVGWTQAERLAWLRFYENARQLFRPEHLAAVKRSQLDLSETELQAFDALAENTLNGTPIGPEMQAILDALLERSEAIRAGLDDETRAALDGYEVLREGFIREAGVEDYDRSEARFFQTLRRIAQQGDQGEIAVLDLTDPLTLWSVGMWHGG